MSDTYLARPALLQQIFDALSSPTTKGVVLVGPGGSGKTVTLGQLVEAGRGRDVWVIFLAVRELRSEEWLGWHIVQQILLERHSYWAEGIPSTELEALRTLGEKVRLAPGREAQELFATFIIYMCACLRRGVQVVIALDEIDKTSDRDAAFRQLELLLHFKPSSFKILVSSRQIASLTQFAMRELLITIEMPYLTVEESKSLLSLLATKSDIDPALLDRAAKISEGSPLLARLLGWQLATGSGDLLSPPTIGDFLNRTYESTVTRAITNAAELAEVERLLLLLALFTTLSVGELSELACIPPVRVRHFLAHLGQFTLWATSSNDAGSVRFFHYVVQKFMLTRLIGITSIDISQLQFGAEEAERDKALQFSFMSPPSVNSILAGDKNIVLGERGSGKSAIFRALRDPVLFQAGESGVPFTMPQGGTRVVPAEDPAAFISTVVEPGASDTSAERFRAAWLLYVSALISPRIRSHPTARKDISNDAWRVLRSVGWQSKDTASTGWFERFCHWAADAVFNKVNKVSFGPVTIEPRFDGGSHSFARRPLDLATYLDQCDELCRAQRKSHPGGR